MTTQPTETIRKPCLFRIGRTGSKTHTGWVDIEIRDKGQPWERQKVVGSHCSCPMVGGVGRLASKAIAYPSGDPSKATCELCKPQD